jgi:hypothetical protein
MGSDPIIFICRNVYLLVLISPILRVQPPVISQKVRFGIAYLSEIPNIDNVINISLTAPIKREAPEKRAMTAAYRNYNATFVSSVSGYEVLI